MADKDPRYWGDLRVGNRIDLASFRVSAAEDLAFGKLTGDENELHSNQDFCERESFIKRNKDGKETKEPLVHGLATLAFSFGAVWKSGAWGVGPVIGRSGLESVRF